MVEQKAKTRSLYLDDSYESFNTSFLQRIILYQLPTTQKRMKSRKLHESSHQDYVINLSTRLTYTIVTRWDLLLHRKLL